MPLSNFYHGMMPTPLPPSCQRKNSSRIASCRMLVFRHPGEEWPGRLDRGVGVQEGANNLDSGFYRNDPRGLLQEAPKEEHCRLHCFGLFLR